MWALRQGKWSFVRQHLLLQWELSINTGTSKPLSFSINKFWIIVFSFLPDFRVWTAASNWTWVQFLQTYHKYHTDSIVDEMNVKVCSELPCSPVVVVTDISAGLVARSLLALTTPWTVSYQAALSIGILQERILEWVAMPSSQGSSWPRDRTSIIYVLCWQASSFSALLNIS